jgi:hypothetical protein
MPVSRGATGLQACELEGIKHLFFLTPYMKLK